MRITVENILDLMYDAAIIQIYVDGHTYEFPIDELSDEIEAFPVHSIDDPYYYRDVHALCINIDADDLEDVEAFKIEYEEYEI